MAISAGEKPTLKDWENHLSTIFPEIRLKKFIEMRGADGGPWKIICALSALWVGLLYDSESQAAALDLIKDWTRADHDHLREQVSFLRTAKRSYARSLTHSLTVSHTSLASKQQYRGPVTPKNLVLVPAQKKMVFETLLSTDVFFVQVPKTALKTPFRQGTVQDLAKKMLQLSKNGLSRRGNHEEPFLEPLQEIAEVGLVAYLQHIIGMPV